MSEEIKAVFVEYTESEHFEEKVAIICKEVVKEFFTNLWYIIVPFLAIISMLVLYIFNTTNATIQQLGKSTEALAKTSGELQTTVALFGNALKTMDDRSRENSDTIKELLKNMYKDSK